MKVQVKIQPNVSRMLESSYDVSKLQNALDAAYNDNTVVTSTEGGISSAKATEKKSAFNSRDGIVQLREGKLTDPLRFIAWNTAITAFFKRNGEPSGELTSAILPANLSFWLDLKFKLDTEKAAKAEKSGGHRNNGNLQPDTGKPAAAAK